MSVESEPLNGRFVKIPSPIGALGFTELIGAGLVRVEFWADDQDPDNKIAAATNHTGLQNLVRDFRAKQVSLLRNRNFAKGSGCGPRVFSIVRLAL